MRRTKYRGGDLSGESLFFVPGDRLFSTMWQILQYLGGLAYANISSLEGGIPHSSSIVLYYSGRVKKCLALPLGNVVNATVNNVYPDGIEIRIAMPPALAAEIAKSGPPKDLQMDKIANIGVAILFVNFFENYKAFFRSEWKDDSTKWPSIVNFSRVVRNAVSHAGKLDIRGANSPPVSWRGLRYGPADHDKLVIGTDLHASDIVFLLLELSERLDRAKAPVVF